MKLHIFKAGLTFLFIIVGTSGSNCQIQSYIDSLEHRLEENNIRDEEKLATLLELTKEYGFVSPEAGIGYGENALTISREMGDNISELQALRYLGVSYHYLNEYNTALAYYDSSLALAIDAGHRAGEEACLFNIGSVYEHLGDFNNALAYYLQSIKIAEETGNKRAYAYILSGIGYIHNQQQNHKLALEYFQKSLKINQELGLQNETAYSLYGIGSTYLLMNDLEMAMETHLRSLEIRKSINDKNGITASLESIGDLYFKQNEYSQALPYYTEALQVAEEIESKWNVISIMLRMGDIYKQNGKFDMAIRYLEDALELAKETESKDLLRVSYKSIADYYSGIRDYDQSLAYYKLYTAMKDSMFNEESSKQIAEMQTIYETDKKDQEIRLQRAEINKRNVQRNALLGGVILFVVLVLVVYRSYRQKKKANKLLTMQNSEINQQKEEIESQRDNLASLNQQLMFQKEKLQHTLEDLKQTQSQLVESERLASLGQLTGGIAHELNNPVNFISGNVNPLKRDIEDLFQILTAYDSTVKHHDLIDKFSEVETLQETLDLPYLKKEISKLLDGMDTGARRSGQIVRGLRSFAGLDEERFILADIHEGLDAAITVLENKAKDRIIIHKTYGTIPQIQCLPVKINHVFLNVLTNSIQAIKGEGEIFIETKTAEDCVTVTIKDTGRYDLFRINEITVSYDRN